MASTKEMQARAKAKRQAAAGKSYNAPKKIIAFGAFYKDDTDNGFGIDWTPVTKHFGRSLSEFAELLAKNADRYNTAIGVDPKWFTKEMIAADLFDQMDNELVPAINQSLYGQPTQPALGAVKNVNVGPILKELIVFTANVKWLQDNGFLVSDNHNGMLYAYSS